MFLLIYLTSLTLIKLVSWTVAILWSIFAGLPQRSSVAFRFALTDTICRCNCICNIYMTVIYIFFSYAHVILFSYRIQNASHVFILHRHFVSSEDNSRFNTCKFISLVNYNIIFFLAKSSMYNIHIHVALLHVNGLLKYYLRKVVVYS